MVRYMTADYGFRRVNVEEWTDELAKHQQKIVPYPIETVHPQYEACDRRLFPPISIISYHSDIEDFYSCHQTERHFQMSPDWGHCAWSILDLGRQI